MTLLAGFDYVAEISNPTILKIIKSTAVIGGVLMNPPFELSIKNGTGHVIVDDIQLDLEGDETINVSLAFSKSSISQSRSGISLGASELVLTPLDGTITVNVALTIEKGLGSQRFVSGKMAGAVVRLDFSPAAEAIISTALGIVGVDPTAFKDGVLAAITQVVRAAPDIFFDPRLSVVAGTVGAVNGGVQLSSLQLHCIGHPDRNRQALSLLGNFFVDTEKHGTRSLKTETAILPGQDFATSFSTRAVHSLIFCPSMMRSIAVANGEPVFPVADLPSTCGGAAGHRVQDIELTSLVDTYDYGALRIFGEIRKSDTCYEASGTFSARVDPGVSADGKSLAFKTTVDEPDVDVSIDWECQVLGMITLGYFSLAAFADVEHVMSEFAVTVANATLQKNLAPGAGSAGLTAPAGTRFSSVSILPQSMTLHGTIEVSVPWVDAAKSLTIVSIPEESSEELTGAVQGDWATQMSCKSEAKTYVYTETQQRQERAFHVQAAMVPVPLGVTWSVRGASRGLGDMPSPSGPSIPLPPDPAGAKVVIGDGWHTLTVPNVDCSYQLPLGIGGAKVTQDVHLDYKVIGLTAYLANRQPAEGNYFILLDASVLDASGTVPAGVDATPTAWIWFQGDKVVMDDEFMADQADCAAKKALRIPKHYLPKWKFEHDPSPAWQELARIRALKEMERRGELVSGEVDRLLIESHLALGDSVARAYGASFGTGLRPVPMP